MNSERNDEGRKRLVRKWKTVEREEGLMKVEKERQRTIVGRENEEERKRKEKEGRRKGDA